MKLKNCIKNMLHVGVIAVLALAGNAYAADISVTGFIRQETAYVTGDANEFNQYGNPYNGQTLTNPALNLGTGEVFLSTVTRLPTVGVGNENDINLFATRAEVDIKVKFTDDWSATIKLRGFYEYALDDEFDDIDLFDTGFDGGKGSVLEANGENYMLDIPLAYLDYSKGPWWFRFGNQNIAWGESLFFRVFDVANGLDLRRHSILSVAAEEYADLRVPSLGIRGSYRFQNDWELEGWVQEFRPTIFPTTNSPYSLITNSFTIQQDEFYEDVEDKLSYGFRLNGTAGDFELSFMAVHRYNPDGVFRWTKSNINVFAGSGVPALEGLGALLSETAFEPSQDGSYSSNEWFHFAGRSRLDGMEALNRSIDEFPATALLGAAVVPNRQFAAITLDTFFAALGPLKGHVAREYKDEDILGFGLSYVFTAEPDTLFDQLILKVEASYAMDRYFTSPTLTRDFIVENELITNVTIEKYHRFSDSFPATYFILEWMHKTESDFLGRHVSGFDNDGIPKGQDSYDAFVFAFQQPFPNLVWRADFTVLYEKEGGFLFQPGVKWRPSGKFQLDLYANIIGSDGDNDDAMETFEDQDEVFARATWFF